MANQQIDECLGINKSEYNHGNWSSLVCYDRIFRQLTNVVNIPYQSLRVVFVSLLYIIAYSWIILTTLQVFMTGKIVGW